jgi:hypothetical protein
MTASAPESTPQTPDKKKLLVFDRFYDDDPDLIDLEHVRTHGGGVDSVMSSLNHERHEVVGSARTIAQACELLIALKDGTLGEIDAIVLAGTLDGDASYSHKPVMHTTTKVSEKQKMFGKGTKQKTTETTTHLIPSRNEDGTITLPTTYRPEPLSLAERDKTKTPRSSIAAYVLSHVTDKLFTDEERPKVILHSGDIHYDSNQQLPVDARVRKRHEHNPNSELAQVIDRLTEEPR